MLFTWRPLPFKLSRLETMLDTSKDVKHGLSICNLCWHFFKCFLSEFLTRWLADSLSSDFWFKWLAENNNKNKFDMKSTGVTLQSTYFTKNWKKKHCVTSSEICINRLGTTTLIFKVVDYLRLMSEKHSHFRKRQKHVARKFFPTP